MKERLKALLRSTNPIVRCLATFGYNTYVMLHDSRLVYWLRFKPYMDDKKYIRLVYKKHFGVYPDLDNPQNFNEKNNWRKLHDHNPRYTDMVDKYKFKDYVAQRAGDGYTAALLGVWDRPEDIDYNSLPEKFVLKANHSGGVIVCRDKAAFDRKKAEKELKIALRQNYFAQSREWPYKNVKRKVLCEAYMGENLTDYKNYCFNGKLLYTFVWENTSREDGRKPEAVFCGAYDRQWNKVDLKMGYVSSDKTVAKPDCYEEMVVLAEKLSEDIPFVRVDCYIIDGKLYAGETTFFPWGGFLKFEDESWNRKFGELEKLPQIETRH